MFRWAALYAIMCGICCGCSTHPRSATVVWISIDGLRGDYLQRVHPPTLSRLAREGAFTTREIPVFPSLTFPNHAAQVTGTTPDRSGVPLNAFYDRGDGQFHNK